MTSGPSDDRAPDARARDGSRPFADYRPVRSWRALCEELARHPGVTGLRVVTDGMDEVWCDFALHGLQLTLHESLGALRCFVAAPDAPDALLGDVRALCERHAQAVDP